MIYLYLALSIANEQRFRSICWASMKAFLRWAMVWKSKAGALSFHGVYGCHRGGQRQYRRSSEGSKDQAISGAVPVIGRNFVRRVRGSFGGRRGDAKRSGGIRRADHPCTVCRAVHSAGGAVSSIERVGGVVRFSFSPNASAKLVGDFSGVMGILLAMAQHPERTAARSVQSAL